jgi:hypothetical protein
MKFFQDNIRKFIIAAGTDALDPKQAQIPHC